MYQLIAFDMDGTLLNSQKEISKENRQAIQKAVEAGKTVILNTGRCLAELEEYVKLLPEIRYLNTVSGAVVYDQVKKEMLEAQMLDPKTVMRLLQFAALEKAMPHLLLDRSIVQKSHWEKMDQFGMGIYQSLYERVAEKWKNLEKEYEEHPFPVAKVNIYHQTAESRARTRKRIMDADLEVTMADAETTALEISLKNINKGVGLEKLCAHLQIPLEQTVVVGDADNDLDALKKAGMAVVMGNADQRIKEIADVVVADCDHGGCVEAIELAMKYEK